MRVSKQRRWCGTTITVTRFLVALFLSGNCNIGFCVSAADSSSCENNQKKKIKVKDLWSKTPEGVVQVLGGIYEHSEWVAETLVKQDDYKSITTVSDLADAMKSIVNKASEDKQAALLTAHPDLAQKVEQLSELTQESQDEQTSAGLQSMTSEEAETFRELNAQYKVKYPFPFILAVRHSTKHTVLAALKGRVSSGHSVSEEATIAMNQVHNIAWMRLLEIVESDELKGFLTCHVLDTANGIPAANMRITLRKLVGDNEWALVGNFVTNYDGRLEGGPALKGEDFEVGTYEWIFHAGEYFASQGTSMGGTLFLDQVPLRFGIDNPDDHYHVPLLVSPWSYSTYRGS